MTGNRPSEIRNLTFAAYAFGCIAIVALGFGVPYAVGWAGDSAAAGGIGTAGGLLSIYGAVRMLQMRRAASHAEAAPPTATSGGGKVRPLTTALIGALAAMGVGVLAGDAAIAVIFGIAGFGIGWLVAIPIQSRRER